MQTLRGACHADTQGIDQGSKVHDMSVRADELTRKGRKEAYVCAAIDHGGAFVQIEPAKGLLSILKPAFVE